MLFSDTLSYFSKIKIYGTGMWANTQDKKKKEKL